MAGFVIISKVKKYVKETADLHASSKSIDQLSHAVEILCKRGIQNAKAERRKTILNRDIPIDHI